MNTRVVAGCGDSLVVRQHLDLGASTAAESAPTRSAGRRRCARTPWWS
ncbi:hypothetical protein ACWEKT_33200 [Nocardia takedensis]